MAAKQVSINLSEHPAHLVPGGPPPVAFITTEPVRKAYYNGLVVQRPYVTHRIQDYNPDCTPDYRLHIKIGDKLYSLTSNSVGTEEHPQYPTVDQYLTASLKDISFDHTAYTEERNQTIAAFIEEKFPSASLIESKNNQRVATRLSEAVACLMNETRPLSDSIKGLNCPSLTEGTHINPDAVKACLPELADTIKRHHVQTMMRNAMKKPPMDRMAQELNLNIAGMHKDIESALIEHKASISKSANRSPSGESLQLPPP